MVLLGKRLDIDDAVPFQQPKPFTLVVFAESCGLACIGFGGQELRRNRLAVVLVGDHHDFLFQVHRHVIGGRQRQSLRFHRLLGQSHAGVIARELRDGFVHAFLEQILIALETMLHITRTVEFQRVAVRTILFEQEIRADIMQQRSDHHHMLVDKSRRHAASGDAVRGLHRRDAQHAERFGTGFIMRQVKTEITGLFRRVRGQCAATGEQRVLSACHAPGDIGHDHAMTMDEIVRGLGLRDFPMQFLDLVQGRNVSMRVMRRESR